MASFNISSALHRRDMLLETAHVLTGVPKWANGRQQYVTWRLLDDLRMYEEVDGEDSYAGSWDDPLLLEVARAADDIDAALSRAGAQGHGREGNLEETASHVADAATCFGQDVWPLTRGRSELLNQALRAGITQPDNDPELAATLARFDTAIATLSTPVREHLAAAAEARAHADLQWTAHQETQRSQDADRARDRLPAAIAQADALLEAAEKKTMRLPSAPAMRQATQTGHEH